MGLMDRQRQWKKDQNESKIESFIGDLGEWSGSTWEYRVLDLPVRDLENALNALGEVGWEVVSIAEGLLMAGGTGAGTGQVRVTVKRPRKGVSAAA
jgi:hypothetical protein